MLGPPKNATTVIPPVDARDLVSYLDLETSFVTAKQFKARKGLEAYSQFVSGWVKEVKSFRLVPDHHQVKVLAVSGSTASALPPASLLPSFPASTAFALNRLPSTSTSPTLPMPTAADSLFCLLAASYLAPPVQPVAASADSSGQPVCEFCLNIDPHLVLRTCRSCGIRYHRMCQIVDESGKRCNKCCFEEG